jgi:hypothetical protein
VVKAPRFAATPCAPKAVVNPAANSGHDPTLARRPKRSAAAGLGGGAHGSS